MLYDKLSARPCLVQNRLYYVFFLIMYNFILWIVKLFLFVVWVNIQIILNATHTFLYYTMYFIIYDLVYRNLTSWRLCGVIFKSLLFCFFYFFSYRYVSKIIGKKQFMPNLDFSRILSNIRGTRSKNNCKIHEKRLRIPENAANSI